MSSTIFVLFDDKGAARRTGLSLAEVTCYLKAEDFTPGEWNAIFNANDPKVRLGVYRSKGWKVQKLEGVYPVNYESSMVNEDVGTGVSFSMDAHIDTEGLIS